MIYRLKIIGGLCIIFLSIYVFYLGSEKDSTLLSFLGIVIMLFGTGVIYRIRHKMAVELVRNYKRAIEDLKRDPDNQELINTAYKHGLEFYKARSGGLPTKRIKKVLERDIAYARGKNLEE